MLVPRKIVVHLVTQEHALVDDVYYARTTHRVEDVVIPRGSNKRVFNKVVTQVNRVCISFERALQTAIEDEPVPDKCLRSVLKSFRSQE